MNIEEIKLHNFRECMALGQKGLYAGVLITALTFVVLSQASTKEEFSLPIIGGNVSSRDDFVVIATLVYFVCGALSSFAFTRAKKIHKTIVDSAVADQLLYFPAIVNASIIYQGVLYAVLIGPWFFMLHSYLSLGLAVSVVLGALLTSPYYLVTAVGRNLEPKG